MKPTAEDMARDLKADLRMLMRRDGLLAYADVAKIAIRRAMAAEALLRQLIEELEITGASDALLDAACRIAIEARSLLGGKP